MGNKKEGLSNIVGTEYVLDDLETLDSYSRDYSFTPPRKPRLVVKPENMEEVQGIVKWANQTGTPLVPVSSGPPHFRGDTVPSLGGAVIIEKAWIMVPLGQMNQVMTHLKNSLILLYV